jgi:hypothetical protein
MAVVETSDVGATLSPFKEMFPEWRLVENIQ